MIAANAGVEGLVMREELTAPQRDEMFSLLARHFEGVTPEQFERDLESKNWVVEIRRENQLVGFSTLLVREMLLEQQSVTAIFSGDTIVAPEAWGSPALARNWIAAVNCLRAAHPDRVCYWLLLTSGFRTYRFLPVFWREFFPRWNVPTPPARQRWLHHLAQSQYGSAYDTSTGIVRFPHPQKLRGSFAAVPPGRMKDPDIAFFVQKNPGYANGDEMACLTEISERNLTAAGHRMLR